MTYILLVTDKQVTRLRKAFANNSSATIKLSKTQTSEIEQSRRFFGRLLGPLQKLVTKSLTKNVLTPFVKSVLIPLGITAVASAVDTGIGSRMTW